MRLHEQNQQVLSGGETVAAASGMDKLVAALPVSAAGALQLPPGVRIVRAYVQEADQARQFDRLNAEYRDKNVQLARASGLFHPLLELISSS